MRQAVDGSAQLSDLHLRAVTEEDSHLGDSIERSMALVARG